MKNNDFTRKSTNGKKQWIFAFSIFSIFKLILSAILPNVSEAGPKYPDLKCIDINTSGNPVDGQLAIIYWEITNNRASSFRAAQPAKISFK